VKLLLATELLSFDDVITWGNEDRLEDEGEIRAKREVNLPQRDRSGEHEKPLDSLGGRESETPPVQHSQKNRIGSLCASMARDSKRTRDYL
jgi:hypothetical protein